MDNNVNDNTSKSRHLRQEFASNVTLHGLRYTFEENRWKRLIWLSILTACTLCSVVLSYDIIADYRAHKSYTSFTRELELEEIEFPTVSICKTNAVSESKVKNVAKQLNESIEKRLSKVKPFFDNDLNNQIWVSKDQFNRVVSQFKKENISNFLELTQRYDISYSDIFEDSTVKAIGKPCVFQGLPCVESLKYTTEWYYGQDCYEFNSFSIFHPSKTLKSDMGMDETLMLFFNFHHDDTTYSYYETNEAAVNIYRYGMPGVFGEHIQHTAIAPGTMTIFQLRLKEIELLPSPFSSNCGEKPFKFLQSYPYSKAACKLDCILEPIYEKCGCVGFELKDFVGDIPICTLEQQYCLRKTLFDVFDKKKHCGCTKSCKQYVYDIEISHGKLGTKETVTKMMSTPGWNKTRKETVEYIRENMYGVLIKYQDTSVLRESVTPAVKLSSLVGSIGGSIGLCVGFSFITGFEFIFFFYEYMKLKLTSLAGGVH